MQVVEVSNEPTVEELIGGIRSIDYMLAHKDTPGLTGEVDSLKRTGAILSLALMNKLKEEGKLPKYGVRMLIMPYSEVCMHMRVAGKRMWGVRTSPQEYAMVQLYALDGQSFSMAITQGEAGWSMQDGD